MTDKSETTESFPSKERWLDNLEPLGAMEVMLEDQGGAVRAVEAEIAKITTAAEAIGERLNGSAQGRMIYAGAGTSARIGVQDGVELVPTFGWPEERLGFIIAGGKEALLKSVENAEDDSADGRSQVEVLALGEADVVVGVSASGATPFTVAVIEEARGRGSLTIGIANNRGARLLEVSDYPLLLDTGGEALAGSTRLKAGTAQKICLNMISTLGMVRLGRVKRGMMTSLRASNAKLRQRQSVIDSILKNQ